MLTNGQSHISEVPDIKPTDKSVLPKDTFSPTTYAVEDSLSTAVVAQRLKRSILHEFPEEEAKARIELACAYRLFAEANWNESIYNHLTARVIEPDGTHAFLINAYGLAYDEITASSLLKIDLDGNILHPGVVGDIFGVNRAGFVIHSAIHRAQPDSVGSVMHNHQATATGIACTETGFIETLSQTSEIIGKVAYHDFQGIVVDENEQELLVQDLGEKKTLFFKNHGVLTTGNTIAAAWYRMYVLIRACEIQVAAQSSAAAQGNKLVYPPEEIALKTFKIAESFSGLSGGMLEFSAYMRRMDKLDPSYRL